VSTYVAGSERRAVKTLLTCPCGESIEGRNEDELVELVQAHLRDKHPDHQYTREQILMMAV
jgi:predicted small metal-binding protein